MNLAILHISDMHLRVGDPRGILQRVPHIVSAVRPRCLNMDGLLLIFSGDLSFSGKKSELLLARTFIDQLQLQLKTNLGLTIFGPVIVPGNHDCNFGEGGDVRPLIFIRLKLELDSIEPDGQIVRQMTILQDEWFELERHYSGVARTGASRLQFTHHYDLGGEAIEVNCFNTAWVSTLKEKQGGIVFPTQLQCEPIEARPELSISVFHHPYRWFEPANGKRFQRMIEKISDVTFTGHEHDGDNFVRTSSQGAEVSYVEGAAFDALDVENGFILVRISTESQTYETFKFIWRDSSYAPLDSSKRQFNKNRQLVGRFFENQRAYSDRLTAFNPPFSSLDLSLVLHDIFVYPDLSIRSLLEKKSKNVPSDKVLDFIVQNRLVDISGPAMSGKTTLANQLYVDLRDHFDYVPVLVSGDDLSGNPATLVSKMRDNAFKEQYQPDRLEDYIQLTPERKALIIDDWHMSRFNAVGRAKFLEVATKEFGIVVTLGTEQHWMEGLMNPSLALQAEAFHSCTIKEFGYLLREKIISKWHRLNGEFELNESEITRKVTQSGHLLNSVVGTGLYPSHPFFVLYALQCSEAEPQSVGTHGSYGHVYEAFLTARFAKISKKPTDIGAKYTYLSLIAYELFRREKKALSPSEIASIHAEIEREYGILLPREQTLRELESVRILGPIGDGVGFLHKYCYFYFVAKYFQKTIGNNADADCVRSQLRTMSEMIHDDEYKNILIFYIYLTEDRQLIEYFIRGAKTFFAEYDECNLEEDAEFIANLIQPKTIEFEQRDVEENRQEFAAHKDLAMEKAEQEKRISTRTRYDETLDITLKLDFAFHALQVMGQVLRNFPGELKLDLKSGLTEESYRLGLRIMKAFLEIMENNLELIRSVIELQIQMHRAKKDESVASDAAHVVGHLTELTIFSMVKRVSFSVGLEDLRETYTAVRKKLGESHLPARLIDLSIRLDHYSKLSISAI